MICNKKYTIAISILALAVLLMPSLALAGELFNSNFSRREGNEIRSRSLFRGGSRGFFDGRMSQIVRPRSSTAAAKSLNPLGSIRSITDIFSGTRRSGKLEEVNPLEARRFDFIRAQKQFKQDLAAWKSGGSTTLRSAKLKVERKQRQQARKEQIQNQQIARAKRKAELDQRSRSLALFGSSAPTTDQQHAKAGTEASSAQSSPLEQTKMRKSKIKEEPPTLISRIRKALFG